MKKAIKSFEIIKEMYEYFVEKYRDLEPKLMICEKEDFDNVETALKDYEKKTKSAKEYKDVNNVAKRLKTLEIIKENLNIDEILLAIKGVCKASDYDLAKEVLLWE